ncbi:putative NRPS-like protein biosynthetic cluster [Sporothrix curviconia]|uniref:NRPS-like protein biosynthetic cluster n=1 Tax=Sporothrix curviconia TaxID=1260050 RepID=A0ABP0B9G1_9PEZI
MAPAAVLTSAVDPFSPHSHFHVEDTVQGSTPAPAPRVVNDLLVRRVREEPYAPFFAYPATPRGKDDYIYHTVGDIDHYADAAACLYLQSGVVPQNPSAQKAEVVALLAPSNVDYVVSTFALSRLGFAVLFLSNRLATEAIVNLLKKTECTKIIVSSHYAAAAVEAAAAAAAAAAGAAAGTPCTEQRPVSVFGLVTYDQYTQPLATSTTAADNRAAVEAAWPSFATLSSASLASRIAFIIHSSGSTGLPKPIFQTHSACLANYESGIPYRAFITLPLFHNHGLSTLFRALCAGKAAALYNASLPLAGSTLVASMRAVAPESLHCVPYALKLMAEDPRGIETLRELKLVLYGGSSCPDELGDRLVAAGVYLAGHYGATEMGQLMTSFRDPETDKDWAYMRPVPSAKPFLRMVPHGGSSSPDDTAASTYECVVLDGLPSKVVSNSDDPPNSFHTRDLFAAHPTRPDAWKYLGRIDDRVTLVNGEKVLPIPYEHQIRQHDLVRECVVFGVGRAVPGIMIFANDKAASFGGGDDKALLDALMPAIEATNAQTEAFGRISREMVAILPADAEYPRTDKGTVIRAAFYQKFAAEIEAVYARFENATADGGADADGDASGKPLLVLSVPELETYLLELFTKTLGVPADKLRVDTDLFEAGVDSLQAITARAQVLWEIDIGGRKPGHNVVFEYPSIRQLAEHFVALRTGTNDSDASKDSGVDTAEIQAMQDLITKYSDFSAYSKAGRTTATATTRNMLPQTVLLTGATGSLGAHILHQLLQQDEQQLTRVYCLVRASSREAAEERVQSTIVSKSLPPFDTLSSSRVVCLPADLSQASLGLDESVLADLRKSLTTVVHAAWAVNFNLGVRSFESHYIRGTRHLLDLCLSAEGPTAARLFFCSSISAAAGTPIPATIAETYIANLAHAQAMGYARSKVVTEHIVRAASEQTGMTAQVLRLGQIVGDSEHGIWNTTEAIPLIFHSALTTGTLPALDETPSWMPVDAMARSVLELSGLAGTGNDLASSMAMAAADPSLAAPVYQVQNCRVFRWTADLLPALREAGLDFEVVSQREWVARLRASDPDPHRNPAIKLIDFYAEKYDNDRPGRAGLVFDTHRTEEASETMRTGFDVIGSGLVAKMVAWWKTQWAEEK